MNNDINKHYTKWCEDWQAAKKKIGDIEEVIRLWQKPPKGWERISWEMGLGFRKGTQEDRGEQAIERQLLGNNGKINLHTFQHRGAYPIIALHHNMALANCRKNQVIADAFGLVAVGGCFHPLAMEVKVTAQNCWSALVQNLQQVRMLRANVCHLQNYLQDVVSGVGRGAWGMVLAPRAYYDRHPECLNACKKLLKRLKDDTTGRVVLATSDNLSDHKIGCVIGNWC